MPRHIILPDPEVVFVRVLEIQHEFSAGTGSVIAGQLLYENARAPLPLYPIFQVERHMTSNVFYNLREQLDQYSIGFPATKSGVELKILEKLFSEEEAALFLNVGLTPETAKSISQRSAWKEDRVSAVLERMVEKGTVFRSMKDNTPVYGAVPFVIGIFEHQINRIDKELAELFDQYLLEALGPMGLSQSAPLRAIPVNKSIDHAWPITPYEDIKAIIQSHDKISVDKCICKVQQKLLGKGCNNPEEVCFKFGRHADYYVEHGWGRFIGKDEAFRIIDTCDSAGLVPMTFVAQDVASLCNCCGDCCSVLRVLKLHPKPAEKVISSYHAEVDPQTCTACGTCEERCQMEAVKIGDRDVAAVDRDRCIGCGLCVSTCPSDALSLKQKTETERRTPPLTGQEYLMEVASLRGKTLTPLKILRKSAD